MTVTADPYQTFAERMFHADSKIIPRILKLMIDDNQARLLISMPGTAKDLAAKVNLPQLEVQNALEDMFIKGLAFKKTKENVVNYRPPAHIAQFHDATLVWNDATQEFYDLWQRYMEEEWPVLAPQISAFLPRPFTRVIPIKQSIDPGKAKVLAPEDITQIIETADRIAVTKCTCRLSMRHCDAPIEVCLQINRGADYTIERKTGREIQKQEALSIIQQAQEAGLVHVTMNKGGAGHFICNCCGCCCQSFTLLISNNLNLCDPSRYLAAVDTTTCMGCGTCIDRCWFGAIELDDENIAVVTTEKCLGCGQCALACPEKAISLHEVRDPVFIPD